MGLFRLSREHRGPDPYQRWKLIIFVLGAAFAAGGIATGRDWMILSAIGILAIGVLLRFLPRGDTGE